MPDRTYRWAVVFSGDMVLGADGRPWRAERQAHDAAVIGLYDLQRDTWVYGRPDPAAAVTVVSRCQDGLAFDLLADVLGAELIGIETREESK